MFKDRGVGVTNYDEKEERQAARSRQVGQPVELRGAINRSAPKGSASALKPPAPQTSNAVYAAIMSVVFK